MGLYAFTQSDDYFGEHSVGFITVSDSYQGTSQRFDLEGGSAIGSLNLSLDNILGSSDWNFVPGIYYNTTPDNSGSVAMAESFYPLLSPLSSSYTENTTLYSDVTLNGNEYSYSGSVSFSTLYTTVGNLTGSVFSNSIYLPKSTAYGNYEMGLTIPILPESAVASNGQIQADTTMYYGYLYINIQSPDGENFGGFCNLNMNNVFSSSQVTDINQLVAEELLPSNDPYSGDDASDNPSGTGGGPSGSDQENWDPDSDPIPVPSLPTISAVDTGFITLYCPTAVQLQNLASYLWSGLFDIETYRKIMADPMDTILGLSIVPVDVPSSDTQMVTVGNIPTGIYLTKANAQFVEINCGTITLSEIWHSYLTYSPYCRMSIMLPFIGAQELDADQIIGATGGLGVVYHVDILSGACVAYITINGNVIAQFAGQCAISIPITASDFTNTITSLCTLVATGVGVVATGGMSAPVQAAAVGGLATAAANTAANVISAKPTFAKSGNISGSNGLMAVQYPYLILEKPKLCAPARQNEYMGYPSYINSAISSLSGFTQIQDIHLDNIGCTDAERNEILTLLRNGVIL